MEDIPINESEKSSNTKIDIMVKASEAWTMQNSKSIKPHYVDYITLTVNATHGHQTPPHTLIYSRHHMHAQDQFNTNWDSIPNSISGWIRTQYIIA